MARSSLTYIPGSSVKYFSGTIPARFGLTWFSGFRGEDLNVIFYQNMPYLHNRYKSAERKISQKKSLKIPIIIYRRRTDNTMTYRKKDKWIKHTYKNKMTT
jgi:hypothetical protein